MTKYYASTCRIDMIHLYCFVAAAFTVNQRLSQSLSLLLGRIAVQRRPYT